MLNAAWSKYRLRFKFEARTSRASMLYKDTYFIKIWDDDAPDVVGIGECALFKGLSADDVPDYERKLSETCRDLSNLPPYSSIVFGVESAMRDLENGGRRIVFPSDWVCGDKEIKINGLVWMGDKPTMLDRINEKIEKGFRCVKLKIGGINFDDEVDLLRYIRQNFSSDELEIRLDANGAFTPDEALRKISVLARYDIHSLEQPIKADQPEAMAYICRKSPVDIALDEELIGICPSDKKKRILDLSPRYIILKPSLCGGFAESDRWISLAEERGIGWWATSALESNVGLNAIAQWTGQKTLCMPQGLGTGSLYHNNIESPIEQSRDVLIYSPDKKWGEIKTQWTMP